MLSEEVELTLLFNLDCGTFISTHLRVQHWSSIEVKSCL